ncbi:MAG: Ca-activated chloride channel [Candidatus Sumerlaeota bacterium]|nr:Ca-activated chloride channel [Candidatus Sumerlaeota bacterium]
MDFVYSHLDPEMFRQINLERLKRLFLELLNRTSGDAERALQLMEHIWKANDIERQTGISFEEFRDHLEEEGLLETDPTTGGVGATTRADLQIQKQAFEEIFQSLRAGESGNHATQQSGGAGDRLAETRPYAFGDSVQDINFTSSIGNAVRRTGFDRFTMEEEDLETFETEYLTSTATAILIDISHSMILYGEDRITPAKKVALSLVEYIQNRYPKDTIDVVLFGDEAVQVPLHEIMKIQVGPFHTNTKAGLEMAEKILLRRKTANRQIFMITDGKPSAITEMGQLYKNPFGLDPKIVSQTINQARHLRRKNIVITTFMITTDPYLQDFVDQLTRANKGRAYYSTLDDLGSFIFADYGKNKKKRV